VSTVLKREFEVEEEKKGEEAFLPPPFFVKYGHSDAAMMHLQTRREISIIIARAPSQASSLRDYPSPDSRLQCRFLGV